MSDFGNLFRLLADAKVEFIVVGGMAAIAHGTARLTQDLDVVYRRTPENLKRLAEALAPHTPYPRGAPPGLPFIWDEETLRRGLNFTLITSYGALDLLGEIAGGGGYDILKEESSVAQFFGRQCLCVNLEALIRLKRAAGRPKDFEAIAELEALFEEREKLEESQD